MPDNTYPMPKHGWTCFHCGETFMTQGAAKEHFGPTPQGYEPGCVIKVNLGGERGLLNALRRAEDEIHRLRGELLNADSHVNRELMRQQSRHSDALRVAEEVGYARGLKDAKHVQTE